MNPKRRLRIGLLIIWCSLLLLYPTSAQPVNHSLFLPRIHRNGCGTHQPAVLPTTLQLGVVHTQGDYRFQSGNFLIEGATHLRTLGAPAIFITAAMHRPESVALAYPDYQASIWPASPPTTLVDLFQTTPYQRVLGMPFSTIVITVYSLAMPYPVNAEYSLATHQAEEDQLYALTRYLLQAYAGCGKTFILKHWEGDSIIAFNQSPTDFSREMTEVERTRMIQWLQARQRGVNRARAELGIVDGVQVFHAVEVNRVLDVGRNQKRRVINQVVPSINADMVAYSAWDSVVGASEAIAQPAVTTAVQEALTIIDQWAPDPLGLGRQRIFLSELGVAEHYRPLMVEEAARWCSSPCTATQFQPLIEDGGGFNRQGLTFTHSGCPQMVLPPGITADVWDGSQVSHPSGPTTIPRVCAASLRIAWSPTAGIDERTSASFGIMAIIAGALDAARTWGVPYAFYWQLYDNECSSSSGSPLGSDDVAFPPGHAQRPTATTCPGYWLIRPDGTESVLLDIFRRYWGPALTSAQAAEWCRPACSNADFGDLIETGGWMNPQGRSFQNSACPALNLPQGFTFDVWDGVHVTSAASLARLPKVCAGSFRRAIMGPPPVDPAPLSSTDAAQWCQPTCTAANFTNLYEQDGSINPRGRMFHHTGCPSFTLPRGFTVDFWDGNQTWTVAGPAQLPRVCDGSFRRYG